MGYLILITIILLLLTILFAYLLYKSAEKNKELDQEIETLMNMKGIVAEVEKKKTEIREKYNEIENNINNNPSVNNDILLHTSKPEHNHDFGDPCLKTCPAYTE